MVQESFIGSLFKSVCSMDTEELVRKCSAITLQEEEKDKITMLGSMRETGLKLVANCLVGKVVLNKGINTEGLRAALQQVWRTIKEFKVESVGNNIFIFKFNSEEEKKSVHGRALALCGGVDCYDRTEGHRRCS